MSGYRNACEVKAAFDTSMSELGKLLVGAALIVLCWSKTIQAALQESNRQKLAI